MALASASRVTRLLVVEDDPSTARALRGILEVANAGEFSVECVSTSAEAGRAVEAAEFDLILLDLGLPDAEGLEALFRLQDRLSEIPVIVLTGNADERTAVEALSHGAEDYLLKGAIDARSLVRSIRYAIERHRSVRELARVKRQLESANENLVRLADIDPLTETLNRRGLQKALTQTLQRAHGTAAALMIDLDDFRGVNGSFGHAVGDVVLKEIARRLTVSIRAADTVGRLGGDEFLVLVSASDAAEVVAMAERIRLVIGSSIVQHSSGTLSMTASVAVLMLTAESPSLDHVLARMTNLLRRGKNEGKNRVVFEQSNFDDTDKRMRMRSDMCSNLAAGKNLLTVRQPIMRLDDETPFAWEFLSRYSNGVFEGPDTFFRVCAERNMLTVVDHFCIRNAVNEALSLPPETRFHINVFPSTLFSIPAEPLLQTFPQPLPRETFCLEISEQQIIGDPSHLIPSVKTLREAGLLIALDDVGFGGSCLESLIALEPDVIKIDKRCVIGLETSEALRRQLKRYLALADLFGADLIAEGVENGRDLAVLRDLGVKYAQGYHWGMPG